MNVTTAFIALESFATNVVYDSFLTKNTTCIDPSGTTIEEGTPLVEVPLVNVLTADEDIVSGLDTSNKMDSLFKTPQKGFL